MNTVEKHRKRYPHARPSTLAYLEARDRMTEQLQRETRPVKASAIDRLRMALRDLALGLGRFV